MEIRNVECALLDIEGTICPITFVKDTLFPYALKSLPQVLAEKWEDAEFVTYRNDFPSEAQQSREAFQAHVEDLTRRDVKIAYLKNLQGYLWQTGYASGAFATPLFADVPSRLQDWKNAGKQIAIYSSGSIFAQKLLFQYVGDTAPGSGSETEASGQSAKPPKGDLRYLILDYFDTVTAGPKTESGSYSKIVGKMGLSGDKVLFLSDSVKEVEAARVAGLQAVVVDRPGNAPLSEEYRRKYDIVTSLSDLKLVV